MTGRKLYTVWYRRDFYIQIGIDWDFPGIKDRIIRIADSFFACYPYNGVISERLLELFLQRVAAEFSSYQIDHMDLDGVISWLARRHKLRLDGKDGITLCKFKIPKWPEYFDFKIKNIEDCKDSFCPDNRINKDIYGH
ncbi:hypothetical protein [Snodgrassella alvi]|uniref:hypothetical protein n=1 Tax=Snodgrassella alvi TaxID=1196083 RepID=UPI000C1E4C2E|nr:hypothetical protein [Snodgrassella alvi]PIT21457.1 hypothetical protein BGI34_01230 [Snodgrassella alvi]